MPRRLPPTLVLAVLLAALAASPALAATGRTHPKKPPKPTSPFAWRGIVEGFYGTPWSHGDRVRMLTWMGAHGFNAYIHAPKGDVYQTTAWRKPYPAGVQANFDREISMAAKLGIQWIPNISPARGAVGDPNRICFSCPGDTDTLMAKLQPFLTAGARTVMLSFDDIAPELGPADAAVYGARYPGTAPEYQFGRATADLLNEVDARLPAGDTLLTVLPDYSGTTDSPYLQGTRDGALSPTVGVLWTGPKVRASRFKAYEAAQYGRLIGRTPIMWENWVARDFVPARIFLGPFNALPGEVHAVRGFFFNPANEPDLNMLPLATAGAWLQNPKSYDPRTAWLTAVDELAGGRQPLEDELRAWAETSYSSGLKATEAPTAVRLQDALLAAYESGARWTDAADSLGGELALVAQARSGLRRLPDRRIAQQAASFLLAAAQTARAGKRALDLLAAERPSLTLTSIGNGFDGQVAAPDPATATSLRAKLASAAATARNSPVYTFGCRVAVRGCGPAGGLNTMDDFIAKVTALDAVWAPSADLAAGQVTVMAGTKRIHPDASGRFTLPAKACGERVLATDGAGGATSLPLPACPKKPKKH
jgi:hyaluronoglucosaminidase